MKYHWLLIALLVILSGYIVPYTLLYDRPFLPALFWVVATLLVAIFTYLHTRRWGR